MYTINRLIYITKSWLLDKTPDFLVLDKVTRMEIKLAGLKAEQQYWSSMDQYSEYVQERNAKLLKQIARVESLLGIMNPAPSSNSDR